jgi:GNAT superfamily N-acetyltransferase
MKRELAGGVELDDDRERIDLDAIHDFLANEAYWAKGRAREVQARLVREARRVLGLYHEGRQVGFARSFSDGHVCAYLADVYVLPEFRGRGLGVELVREAVERDPEGVRRWLLHTADAHALYERFGFVRRGEKLMERE